MPTALRHDQHWRSRGGHRGDHLLLLRRLRPPLASETTPTSSKRQQVAEAGRRALAALESQLLPHRGRFVAVDVDSAKWVVADSVTAVLKEAREKLPRARL